MYDAQDEALFLEDGGIIVDYNGSPVYVGEDGYSPKKFMDMLFKDVCNFKSLDKLAAFLKVDPEDLYETLYNSPTPEDIGELIGNRFTVTTAVDLPSEEI